MKIDHSDYAKWSVILLVIMGKNPPEENHLPSGSGLFSYSIKNPSERNAFSA
jgi:hypothetical protein